MKKLIYQTALFAYVNTLCFRNLRPTCTKISEQFNRNIIFDSEKNPYVSHDKLQRFLEFEGKWNEYLRKRYGHLIKFRKSLRNKKAFLIIDDTVLAKPFSKELDLLSWIYSSGDKQYLYGLNIVFLIWTDGDTRYPIGFRIWNKDDKRTRKRKRIQGFAQNNTVNTTLKFVRYPVRLRRGSSLLKYDFFSWLFFENSFFKDKTYLSF